MYLNIAEWAPGRYGAGAAAQYWFDLNPEQLSKEQAARLAAILPNPKQWKAQPAGPYVVERSRWIEGQMGELGSAWLGDVLTGDTR